MGQLVEVAEQALHARVDQFLGDAIGFAARVNEARDAVQHAAVAGAEERRAHRLALAADGQQHFEQAEQDELLPGHRDVGAGVGGILVEQEERLVHRVGPAGDNQGPVSRIDPPGVADQLQRLVGVHAHGRDHEQVRHPSVELHPRRAEIAIPLLEDDPGLGKARVGHRRADRPDACGHHAPVGVDEREHSRAVVERAGDHRRQVVPRRQSPQSPADFQKFARAEQFVPRVRRGSSMLSVPTVRGAAGERGSTDAPS